MKLKLELFDIVIDDLLKNPSGLVDCLGELNFNKLQDYIVDNLSSLDGGPSINNLQVENFQYDVTNQLGSFRLCFNIDRRFCCSDIESCRNDYLDFDFKIINSTLIAFTEYFDWDLNN